ncbi:MAG: cell division protein FtsK [Bacteroidetes bacterium 4572_77]|nr:MAG: cell division protein FtsK [Bacteroidetes bacterium 4572_77]
MARKTNKKKTSNNKATKKKTALQKPSFSFVQSDKFKLILGVFFLLSSLFLAFSFTSYFFYWTADYDKIFQFSWQHISGQTPMNNWGGFIGAWIGHLFIYKMFGLPSVLFILLFFLVGSKLLINVAFLPLKKTFKISFISMLWFSIVFGLLFRDSSWAILGGTFGYQTSLWLNNLMGLAGLILLLGFTFIIFAVLHFSFPTNWMTNWQNKENDNKAAKLSDSIKGDRYNTSEYAVDEEDDSEITLKQKHNPLKEESVSLKEEPISLVVEETEKIKPPVSDLDLELEIPEDIKVSEEARPQDLPKEELNESPELKVESGNDKKADLKHGIDTPYDPTEDLADFVFPGIDLLEMHGADKINIYKEELEANKNRIVETLENYKIKIQKIKATVGPTVTLYEIVPAPGVRISKIKNLEDDIALSLSALGIRIIAPIPGKGSIGIEVPNSKPEIVPMRSVIQSKVFQDANYELPIVMGKTISNESYAFDLAKMPHLLMAGATGQGKSVGLNAIIASLLYKKHPSQLKFVMVDPKKVELTLFSKIERHYLAKLPDSEEAIITDTQAVVHTLYSLVTEMDNRYDLLKDAQVRNIKEYNAKFIARRLNPEKGHKYMPYIVLVVDEFADLMMTAGKEVEGPIARLAQLARAIGIHLIIATQRPSVNVITGIIKANFPARIAFRVTSRIDSRTILDAGGADQLIGRGDMLISTGNEMTRIQCAFIDTPEVDAITEFIGSQRAYPSALILPETEKDLSDQEKDINPADRDELFEDAAHVIVNAQQGSTSLIQRKLKLGYNRAGRIIDQLEAAGIVGPFEGSKAREVRVANTMALEQFLKDLYMRDQE